MNIWNECPKEPITKLLSFIVDNRGKTVPTSDEGHILIATNCIKNDSLYPKYEKVRYLSQDTYDTFFRAHPIPGDIIFVNKGTPGRVCLVPDPIDFCIAQDMIALRVDSSKIYNKYLLAVLRSDKIQKHIYNTNVGDVIPHFKKQFMDTIEVPLPSYEHQRKIGDFYFNLSQKIETNNKINANLEEMAQAIFKNWFVDFAPFKDGKFVESELGMIPEGWRVGTLSELMTIKRGGSPRPIQDYLTDKGLRWLKISDATSINAPYIFEIKEHIKEEGLSKTVFLKAGELVLSNSATPCVPKFLAVDSCIHDGWLHFSDMKISKEYMYLFFLNMREHIMSQANGSVFLNLKTDIVKNQVICYPDDITMERFNNIIIPLFRRIKHLQEENAHLASIRDTLLPRLMSGEIEV